MALESKIESIKIKGFRSLAEVELNDLPDAAVLIGPNGAGKSNLLLFLEMLQQMLRYRRLTEFVARRGGANDQLFMGSAMTSALRAEIQLKTAQGSYCYECTLTFAHPEHLFVNNEKFTYHRVEYTNSMARDISNWGLESGLLPITPKEEKDSEAQVYIHDSVIDVRNLLGGFAFHHFHNTDFNANIKTSCDITDNVRLRADGGNLAAILFQLERENTRRYDYICNLINRILPTFDRFDLEESYGKVMLRWKARGSDKTMGAHLTSDGSLRYFCLVTLLNLPPEMLPSIILLDEPELGLHPSAVGLIGAMIRVMSRHRQVIVATQSPLLVDEFNLGEIYVFDMKNGETRVHRPDEEELKHWLEKYSTGEIWLTNLIGGRPWSVSP